MRNAEGWITLAAIVGPLILGGALFIPVAAALGAAGFQVTYDKPGVAPQVWVLSVGAVLLAVFIYPSHFDSVAKCDAIAAEGSLEVVGVSLSLDSATRLASLEAGCDDLPFYDMPFS